MHEGHAGMSAATDTSDPMPPAIQAKLLADKKESEFNHHLAGWFVALAGLFVLFQSHLVSRHPWVKYVWPATFGLSGIFVAVWSDTELWPFGQREWLEALRHNPEVLQHKLFAVLLLVLGTVEWQRARGVLKAAWSSWVFPIIALTGSALLLFHHHEAGAHGPNHMALMARIQLQHLSFALAGFAIGTVKALEELRTPWRSVMGRMWPALMVALGILLMFYRE